ncbi:MAG: DUF3568 family protein [Candidatus Fonsibacter ubiquis]|nr:DUF3568 family protein [Candidatus Fonsibacter ubiquis]
MIRALIISICFSFLVGCNTLSDAQKAEGQGKKVSYQAPFNKTWDASIKALSNLKLNVAKQDKNQGTIFAETSLTFTSYGETNIFAKEWADEIHLEIAKELKK